jgi:hypothetical protein
MRLIVNKMLKNSRIYEPSGLDFSMSALQRRRWRNASTFPSHNDAWATSADIEAIS